MAVDGILLGGSSLVSKAYYSLFLKKRVKYVVGVLHNKKKQNKPVICRKTDSLHYEI
jgi:hypothetical protein